MLARVRGIDVCFLLCPETIYQQKYLDEKGIDAVSAQKKILRMYYTDFSPLYEINANVYAPRHHSILRKFLHIPSHVSISSGYDLPQKKTFKWLF